MVKSTTVSPSLMWVAIISFSVVLKSNIKVCISPDYLILSPKLFKKVDHPAAPTGNVGVGIGGKSKSVTAEGEDMQLIRNAYRTHSFCHLQRVLHGNEIVLGGVPN
jgi:hypothetical protein